jgi:7-cyano-7-deazaguanine synthase in queuosine biosynthesis
VTEAVLLNSGGIDSRVAAHIMTSEDYGWHLHSLHIPFNPHNKGACRKAAQKTARQYCVEHYEAREPDNWITQFKGFWGLPHTGIYVHLMGAIYAVSKDIQWVVSGYRKDVMAFDWTRTLTELLSASKVHRPAAIVMPLKESVAADAGIRMAKDLDVDISDTHSCWTDPPCGTCHKCKARSGATATVGGAGVHSQ